MNLSSLLVSADEASAQVLWNVLDELDCENLSDVTTLLRESHSSRHSGATVAIVVVGGQEKIREMFTLGVSFVLYKPITHERAMSTLLAAQSVLFRDKRRNKRVSVHTQATIDYAGAEQSKAALVDIAHDGMAVNFGKHLPPTCKVYFQFQLPGQSKTIRLSGLVIWQDWSGRAGVQFVDVPQSSRQVLTDWLAQNSGQLAEGTGVPGPSAKNEPSQPFTEEEIVAADWSGEKPAAKQHDREAVARFRSEPGNRRGETRYSCRLGAEVYQRGSSVRNYCHLSDLSPGGCYLEMPVAFSTGSQVEITVRTYDVKLRLSGEVRASHPGYGMGISFKLNTKDQRLGVQQLIDFVAATAKSS